MQLSVWSVSFVVIARPICRHHKPWIFFLFFQSESPLPFVFMFNNEQNRVWWNCIFDEIMNKSKHKYFFLFSYFYKIKTLYKETYRVEISPKTRVVSTCTLNTLISDILKRNLCYKKAYNFLTPRMARF